MTEIEIYGMNLSRIRVADIEADATEQAAEGMPPAEAISYREYAQRRRARADDSSIWVLMDRLRTTSRTPVSGQVARACLAASSAAAEG
jgi:hypothetical protein